MDLTIAWFKEFLPSKCNCSLQQLFTTSGFTVTANQSGYYDRDTYFGALQYNEIDVLLTFSKLPLFQNPEVVRLGAPIFSAKAIVINAVKPPQNYSLEVIETMDVFQPMVYVYLLIALSFVMGVTFHYFFGCSLFNCIWKTSTGLMNQIDDFQEETFSSRILWLHFMLFIFFFVAGIMGGLISADMSIDEPRIEELKDLLDPKFNMTPVLSKQDILFDTLARTPKESLEHQIITIAEKRGSLVDLSLKEFDAIVGHNIQNALYSITKHDHVLLHYDVFAEKILLCACVGLDKKEPIFAPAKHPFAQDIFFPFSHAIQPARHLPTSTPNFRVEYLS